MTSQDLTLPEQGDLIGGRFRILEVLGTGGFGTVYKALQENIGRDVALKFLTPGVAKDPINVERFRREAYHVSQLRHPNTITLYDYGQTEEGLAYMVMEFLEGDALGDLIQRDGAIEIARAAHIYIQILKSLSEAHRRGLVHRDLKPENIFLCEMFGEQDYVKVLDFGVAKMTMADSDDEEGAEALTRAGRIFGTPMYMAPEQACAEPITPATDVYALGLLLFE
ncbi:MAG: serine/threonine protein kinase, partial [Bradymonadaceae bacterium]